jgi:hypothetical protein
MGNLYHIGSVGIGVSSPETVLHLKGQTNIALFGRTGGASNKCSVLFESSVTQNTMRLTAKTNDSLSFSIGAATPLSLYPTTVTVNDTAVGLQKPFDLYANGKVRGSVSTVPTDDDSTITTKDYVKTRQASQGGGGTGGTVAIANSDTSLLNPPIGTVIVVDGGSATGIIYSGGAASPARLANFPNSSNKIVRYTSNNNSAHVLRSTTLSDLNGKVEGTWQLIGGMKFSFAGDTVTDPFAWHWLVCQRIS